MRTGVWYPATSWLLTLDDLDLGQNHKLANISLTVDLRQFGIKIEYEIETCGQTLLENIQNQLMAFYFKFLDSEYLVNFLRKKLENILCSYKALTVCIGIFWHTFSGIVSIEIDEFLILKNKPRK